MLPPRRSLLWGTLLVIALVWTPSARIAMAQPSGSDAEARALFQAGEVAYGEGRYEAALEAFERAYALSPRPQMLFNIGSAAEHLRRDDEALEALRGYVAALPEAPNREAVERRIAILEQAVAARATASGEATPSGTAAAGAGAPASSSSSDPAPWILVGIGGAVLVGGIVTLAIGYANVATVEGARGVTWSALEGAYRDAPVLTGVGWAAAGVGAAMALAGIVWGALPSGPASPEVTGWLTPESGGLVLRGAL